MATRLQTSEPLMDLSGEAGRPPELRWRSLAVLEVAAIATLILLIYARTLLGLFEDWWNDPSFSQGLLIPPFALYFAWLDRKQIFDLPPTPTMRGLWAVVGGCLVYLIGKLGAEFFLQRISLMIVLTGLIWTWWGKARLTRLAFPLILMATMIPLPALIYNAATAPLQLFASDVATKVAQFFNVSVFRDGNIIELAHISLGVDEACSGLNSFSALLMAGVLLGQFLCERLPARILLVLLSAPLSIAVNVMRISGTAILADYNEQFALGFYHTFAGWLVFVVGFFAFVGIAKAAHTVLET
ncbi:MAG TPA: exosortase/archaeosortase family protein [Bryobacteraceae bacterium]